MQLHIFDIDDTLIASNKDDLVKNLYLTWNPVLNLPTSMLLRSIQYRQKLTGDQVFLVTNRHPSLQEDIAKYFGLPLDHVYCRSFAITIKEILKIDVYPDPKARDRFFKDMHAERIRFIKTICQENLDNPKDFAIYYDDLADRYTYEEFEPECLGTLLLFKPNVPHVNLLAGANLLFLEREKQHRKGKVKVTTTHGHGS